MIGIELVRDKVHESPTTGQNGSAFVRVMRARELGMLTRPLGNVIVFIPPLASTEAELGCHDRYFDGIDIEVTEGGSCDEQSEL